MAERIPQSSLQQALDGEVIYGARYTLDNEVVRAGVNANYSDILKILQGQTVAITSPDSSVTYLKVDDDGFAFVSTDNEIWLPLSSTGHIILNSAGTEIPQRTKIQFTNTIITYDSDRITIQGLTGPQGAQGIQGVQGVQGIQGEVGPQGAQGTQGPIGETGPAGENGADGNSFYVLGRYTTLLDLTTAHPTGSEGDAWLVGSTTTNVVYGWNVDTSAWQNYGSLQGPAGPQGIQGEVGPQGAQGIQGVQGVQGIQGEVGPVGPAGEQGPAGEGVASGGTTGQVLKKTSATDYETEWGNLPTVPDIADNLTTNDATKTLSAKQGKTLKDLIGTALADLTTSVKTSIILAINSLVTVKEDKVTITTDASSTTPTVSLVHNREYVFSDDAITTLGITLSSGYTAGFIASVVFVSPASAPTVTLTNIGSYTIATKGDGTWASLVLTPKASKTVTMIFNYDGINMNIYVSEV